MCAGRVLAGCLSVSFGVSVCQTCRWSVRVFRRNSRESVLDVRRGNETLHRCFFAAAAAAWRTDVLLCVFQPRARPSAYNLSSRKVAFCPDLCLTAVIHYGRWLLVLVLKPLLCVRWLCLLACMIDVALRTCSSHDCFGCTLAYCHLRMRLWSSLIRHAALCV